MATIAPFAGIHYTSDAPLSELIAPPYDVLSPAQQDALYAKNLRNIVRLILSKEQAGDAANANRYTRAADFLRESLASGVLVQDEKPALYEYIQRFEHPANPEQMVSRRTLLVALKLAPYSDGVVLPHEETHPKAKTDRLNLMQTTQVNAEPIYGLYEDPNQTVAQSLDALRESAELILRADFPGQTAPDAEQHRIYRHTDACLLSDLEEFFGPRRVWIADGHHRYETALNYQAGKRGEEGKREEGREGREEGGNRREQGTGNRGEGVDALQNLKSKIQNLPSDFILIGLSAFEDPGLVVLPTHRLIKNVSASRREELPLLLERYFHVAILTGEKARGWLKTEVAGEKRFVVLLPEEKAYALTLRDLKTMDSAVTVPHCAAWKHLDVSILQTLVLDRCLGIGWQDLAHTPDVAYTRDEAEAVSKVANGEFQMACLLQNPQVTEVRDVASAGDKMPQKSTFFYPKLWSGLILRSLAE